MILYALTRGYLDDIPVSDIRRFEMEMYNWLDQESPAVLEHIRTTGDLPSDEEMDQAISAFKKLFVTSAHS